MTSFTDTWNTAYEALPADTEQLSQGDDRIRSLKKAVRERLEVDHSWDGDADDGEHKKVTLEELASDPTNIANKGIVYTKDDGSGNTELFYVDEGGTVTQITGAAGFAQATRTLTAGLGLSGGGDLSADRTFALDFNELTTETSLQSAVDFIPFYDDDAATHKKMSVQTLRAAAASGTLTLNDNGQTSAAHGLGALPDRVHFTLECTTDDQGFTVGQHIPIGSQMYTQTGPVIGCVCFFDDTNVYVNMGADLRVVDSAGARATLTTGSWRVAWKAVK